MNIFVLLGYLICAIAIASFAVWATRKFVPAEFQKFVFLLLGLVGLILFCYIVMVIVGGGLSSVTVPGLRR